MSITTLPLVKQFLGIPASNTSKDFWLTSLMDAAEVIIRNYCRRDFESQQYVEYYSGTDRRELILRQTPVTQLIEVKQDFFGAFGDSNGDPFNASTALIIGQDVDLDYDCTINGQKASKNGILLRLNTVWEMRSRSYYPLQLSPEAQTSDGSIKVTYVAGYTQPLPMDLQMAVAWIVAYLRRTIVIGGELDEERIGDYQYHIFHPRFGIHQPEIASAREVLDKYREVVL